MPSLAGKEIVLTRPLSQSASLQRALEAAGARVRLAPLIRTDAVRSPDVDAVLGSLNDYDWLVFTSANGIRHLLQRLDELEIADPAAPRIAAIGPATARAAAAAGMRISLTAGQASSEGLAASFAGLNMRGKRIALLTALATRDILRPALAKMGGQVTQVGIYATAADEEGVAILTGLNWSAGSAVIFMSGSAAEVFARNLPGWREQPIRFCAIGSATAERMAQLGLPAHAVAEEATTAGVVKAVLQLWD